MTDDRAAGPPNPAWLLDEFRAFERTLALRTAIEMDLFTRIGGGANTVRKLAAASGASERGLRTLCDFLTIHGHLLKQGGRYRLTLHSRLYLTTASPAYLGSAVRSLASDATVSAFCRLREAVKRGGASRDAVGGRSAEWVDFARFMAPAAQPVAEFAAAALEVHSAGPMRVLDVAAGHGLYGLAIAAKNPSAQIYALDSPEVLKIAMGNARRAGAADRFHLIPGDAFATGFGGPYDLAIAANFAHHLDERANVRLFRKCLRALRPGGRIALIDFVPHADRLAPAADASFALPLLATTARGDVYTFAQFARMLRAAGFRRVRHPDTGGFPRWIVTALR